jgi:hypothetical protein
LNRHAFVEALPQLLQTRLAVQLRVPAVWLSRNLSISLSRPLLPSETLPPAETKHVGGIWLRSCGRLQVRVAPTRIRSSGNPRSWCRFAGPSVLEGRGDPRQVPGPVQWRAPPRRWRSWSALGAIDPDAWARDGRWMSMLDELCRGQHRLAYVSLLGASRMLDSPEGGCAGQVWLEYQLLPYPSAR